jgi:hypothetical protein
MRALKAPHHRLARQACQRLYKLPGHPHALRTGLFAGPVAPVIVGDNTNLLLFSRTGEEAWCVPIKSIAASTIEY